MQGRLFMTTFTFLWLVGGTLLQGGESLRTFTDTRGREIEARFLRASQEAVVVETKQGKEFTIPLAKLSQSDIDYVSKILAQAKALNESIGQPLFDDTGSSLWESDPKAVAKRLAWRLESETSRLISFRRYPETDYRFLNARPYSVALQGSEGKVDVISIVFANKGDLFGASGSAEAHFDRDEPVPSNHEELLRQAIANDLARVNEALTKIAGPAAIQTLGEGAAQRKAHRWDWRGHAFLVTVDEQYVGLRILPVEVADGGGKTARVPDSEVRKRIRANVTKRPNGDVVIKNIPMVHQGPKGYCVPATFERSLRYLDVPADMYLLAIAGNTSADGMTYTTPLINAIKRDVKRKGRRFELISKGNFKLSKLARILNEGTPIIWGLYSTPTFNETANTRTAARRKVSDWSAWKQRTKAFAAKADNVPVPTTNLHVAIIIGYNKKTGEIAFSDSWGPEYQERWLTFEEVLHHSQDSHYVIRL